MCNLSNQLISKGVKFRLKNSMLKKNVARHILRHSLLATIFQFLKLYNTNK